MLPVTLVMHAFVVRGAASTSSIEQAGLAEALPSYRARLLHLTSVWAYGVSQPVFSLAHGNPELLLAHGASRREALIAAALIAFILPLTFVAGCWLLARISGWTGDMLYLVGFGACLVPLAFHVVRLIEPPRVAAYALVSVVCAAGVGLYARSRPVRLFLGYSIVLPILGFAWLANGLTVNRPGGRSGTSGFRQPHSRGPGCLR